MLDIGSLNDYGANRQLLVIPLDGLKVSDSEVVIQSRYQGINLTGLSQYAVEVIRGGSFSDITIFIQKDLADVITDDILPDRDLISLCVEVTFQIVTCITDYLINHYNLSDPTLVRFERTHGSAIIVSYPNEPSS